MEVIIQPAKEAASSLVARIVAHELRANPHLVLGLATGKTMECVYRHLVRMHREEKLDFSLCRTFNLDEYVGLFPSDPNSYRHYMDHHLFRHVNVDIRNTHLPNGLATDLDSECRRYEALIQRFGGIDLQAAEQLKWLYILPGYQGTGLGSRLLQHVEKIGWEAGLSFLRLHAAPASVEFYRKRGYRAVEEGELIGHDHEGVEMWKERESDNSAVQ